jgi:PKD domain
VRALATSLAVLAALLALPAGALGNDQVRVEPEGSPARTVSLSGLGEPDVPARVYTVDDGTGARRVPVTGYSLDRLLDAADVDPYRFAGLEVSIAGASVGVSRDEVTRAGSFAEGPPVFWMEGVEPRFVRPAGASAGSVLLAGAGPVAIRLMRPSRLTVSAEASDRRVDPGDPVTFTATVAGAPVGEQVDVTWYFDDGSRGRGPRPTHRFRTPGTYDVTVGARTSPGDPGAFDIVSVRVGNAPDGPNRRGGGTSRDADAPDSGVGAGAGGSSATGGSRGSDESNGAGEGVPARAAAERRRERGRRRGEQRESRPQPAQPRARSEPGEASASRQVRGIELAGLSALSSQAGRDALRAARRGRLREDDEDSGAGIPAAVWWALGLSGLLGLGAWREARSGPAGRPATDQ